MRRVCINWREFLLVNNVFLKFKANLLIQQFTRKIPLSIEKGIIGATHSQMIYFCIIRKSTFVKLILRVWFTNSKYPSHYIFIDFKQVYSTATIDELYNAMNLFDISAKLIKLCWISLMNTKRYVMVGGTTSNYFSTIGDFR